MVAVSTGVWVMVGVGVSTAVSVWVMVGVSVLVTVGLGSTATLLRAPGVACVNSPVGSVIALVDGFQALVLPLHGSVWMIFSMDRPVFAGESSGYCTVREPSIS